MSRRGFANIILIILVVVLAGTAGYFALTRNQVKPEQPTTPLPSTQNSTPQAPTPPPVAEKPIVPPTTDSSRVISCNPRGYDPEYFKREKPCVSDMTAVDIERENKALSIINKAIAAKPSLQYTYGSFPKLFVSDKRYQLINVNVAPFSGYVVVDTVGEKVTDYFVPRRSAEESPKRFVFSDGSTVGQYTFGREKSIIFSESKIYDPQTYYYYDGPEGSTGVKVLASTSNSITLGIYDRNKSLPQKPGDDFVQFEQVGTKIINLAN